MSVQAYGRDLAEANEWCKKYSATCNVKDLTQAWELYYHVFRRISKQLPQVSSIATCILCIACNVVLSQNEFKICPKIHLGIVKFFCEK